MHTYTHTHTHTHASQGGYFIINGSEKVLIAQERMATNHVYVFKKSQPSKYTYIAECRQAFGGGSVAFAPRDAPAGCTQQGGLAHTPMHARTPALNRA